MKTLWIVSGSTEAVPGIQRAKEMGLYVIVSDGNPSAPGFTFSDESVIASTYDVKGTVSAAKRYHQTVRPIDGVLCIASDVPLTVACIADALGLPGISIETARLATDKLAMKRRFNENGLPIPWYNPVENKNHLMALVKEHGYPLIIKPVDSRGARGVLRLTADVDLSWAYERALQFSPSGRVMVEEYLEGQQISTESVIIENRAYTPGFTDRNYEYLERFAPYIIENGGQQPSELSPDERKSVVRLAEKAGRAMGIRSGIAKGDMVLTEAGPKIIEIAARLSGGWLSTVQIPLATGIDLISVAIMLAFGEEISQEDLIPRYQKEVAIRYFFPEPGRVIRISNIDKFKDISWIHRLELFIAPGDIVEPVTDHTKRAGFVITAAETGDKAVERALQIINTIQIETSPI